MSGPAFGIADADTRESALSKGRVPTVGFAAVRTSHERDSGAVKGLAAGVAHRPF